MKLIILGLKLMSLFGLSISNKRGSSTTTLPRANTFSTSFPLFVCVCFCILLLIYIRVIKITFQLPNKCFGTFFTAGTTNERLVYREHDEYSEATQRQATNLARRPVNWVLYYVGLNNICTKNNFPKTNKY